MFFSQSRSPVVPVGAKVELKMDITTGLSRGFAFVSFIDEAPVKFVRGPSCGGKSSEVVGCCGWKGGRDVPTPLDHNSTCGDHLKFGVC